MDRLTLEALSRLCQKPDHRRVGNWMACRVARPLALRVTWVVYPLGISAHAMTLVAWLISVAAAAALAGGSTSSWLWGAALLQLWYLLDHVDGQLARLRGTASLDGVQLDYLMHHAVNVLVPTSIGWGLFLRSGNSLWAGLGLAWAMALLLLNLQHDAAYKAFVQRLKCVDGQLLAVGGGGARPGPPTPRPAGIVPTARWLARKLVEIHVIMNLITAVAVAQWFLHDNAMHVAMTAVACTVPLAWIVSLGSLARSQRRQSVEREFAAWFQVPADHDMLCDHGWWRVVPREPGETRGHGEALPRSAGRSS